MHLSSSRHWLAGHALSEQIPMRCAPPVADSDWPLEPPAMTPPEPRHQHSSHTLVNAGTPHDVHHNGQQVAHRMILWQYFQKMNTVAKPRTTVQMLSTAVKVFSENEYGREAADHSADVITGKKNIRHYTVTPHHSRHPSHLTTSNITHSHLTISHITRRSTSRKTQFHHITHHTSLHLTRQQTSHVTISHITSRKKRTQRRSSWSEFLGRMAFSPPHTSSHLTTSDSTSRKTQSHHITHHTSLHLTRQQTSHVTISHITSRKKRTQRRSSWSEFLGRMAFSPPHTSSHQTAQAERRNLTTSPSHITHHCISPDSRHHMSPYHTAQAERRERKEEVLGPSSWAGWHSHHLTHHHISPHQTSQAERRNLTTSHITHHCISPDSRHHMSPYHTSQAERREHKEEVLGPSSWAGWLTTPHHRHHITHDKPKEENTQKKFLGRVLGPDGSPHHITDITSHHITHYKPKEENTEKKLLGRVLGPDRRNLTTSHITHDRISPDTRYHISPHHTSPKQREHTEEVLGPSSWSGWHSHHITHHHISPHQTSQAERLTTRDITSHHITHHRNKENTQKKFLGRVLGPDGILTTSHIITSHHIRHRKPKGSPHHITEITSHHTTSQTSHLTTSHMTSQKKRTHRRSSWAEFLGRMAHHTTSQTSHHTTSHMTSRKKRTQRISCWAEFLGRIGEISPHHTSHMIASHQTRDITSHHITHHRNKENTQKKFVGRVLGPDGILTTSHIITSHHIRHHKPKGSHHTTSQTSHLTTSHMTSQKKRTHRRSSWAEFLGRMAHHTTSQTSHHTTSHMTSRKKRTQRRSCWAEFLGRIGEISPHHTSHMIASHQTRDITSHHITHHRNKENTQKKFVGRVLGPDGILTTSHIITSHHIRHHKPKGRKSTSFIVKTLVKSIPEERKVRELPRKINIEEVEEPKKYENYHAKPVSDPFKSMPEHRKVRELPRNMNIEEVEEPETTKIHIQTPRGTAAATRKVRK